MPMNNSYGAQAAALAGSMPAGGGQWNLPTFNIPGLWSPPNPTAGGAGQPLPGTTPTTGGGIGTVPGQGPGMFTGGQVGDAASNAAQNAAQSLLPDWLQNLINPSEPTADPVTEAINAFAANQQNAGQAGSPLHVNLGGPMPGNMNVGGYEVSAPQLPTMGLNDPLTGLLDVPNNPFGQEAPATLNTDLGTIMGNAPVAPNGRPMTGMGSYRGSAGMVQGLLDPSLLVGQIDSVNGPAQLPEHLRPGRGLLR